MKERRCPYCNELVPTNGLTCPACYRAVPREDRYPERQGCRPGGRSRGIAIGLAVIPGVFGVMGLGQIYLGNTRRGTAFLLMGLPLMLVLALLISSMGDLSTGWTVLAIGATVLFGIPYFLLFTFQLLDAAACAFRCQ